MEEPTLWDLMPRPSGAGERFVATAGTSLPAGGSVATEDDVVEALKGVHDPEIPVNIYDLGLIYALDIGDDGDVYVEMTLTTPGCPVAGQMPTDVANAVARVPGVGKVEVHLVWSPGWTKDRMSEDAQLALGMFP
jgi:FeS assembly SUF system protein